MNLEHAASLKTSIENGNYVTSCFLPCNYPSPIKWTKNSNQCLNLRRDKGSIYVVKTLVKVLSKLMKNLWQYFWKCIKTSDTTFKWFTKIICFSFFQVRELVSECQCPTQFPMIRVSEGKYRIGDTQVLIFVRVSNTKIV